MCCIEYHRIKLKVRRRYQVSQHLRITIIDSQLHPFTISLNINRMNQVVSCCFLWNQRIRRHIQCTITYKCTSCSSTSSEPLNLRRCKIINRHCTILCSIYVEINLRYKHITGGLRIEIIHLSKNIYTAHLADCATTIIVT